MTPSHVNTRPGLNRANAFSPNQSPHSIQAKPSQQPNISSLVAVYPSNRNANCLQRRKLCLQFGAYTSTYHHRPNLQSSPHALFVRRTKNVKSPELLISKQSSVKVSHHTPSVPTMNSKRWYPASGPGGGKCHSKNKGNKQINAKTKEKLG